MLGIVVCRTNGVALADLNGNATNLTCVLETSTGKISPAATPPVTLVMLEAVRDFFEETGVRVGVKAAGGVRSTKDALKYLVLVNETVGEDWLTPDLWRFGASALLNDLVLQRDKQRVGHYGRATNYSND